MPLRLLRLFLGSAPFAWGVTAVGVLLGWTVAVQALEGIGARP